MQLTMAYKSYKIGKMKLMLICISLIVLFSFILLVSALSDEERELLQSELSSLESELGDNGYSWLINYSGEFPAGTPRIEVYEKDGNEIIAEFYELINNEYNKVYLTELEGRQDVFDLRVVGEEITQKKKRIDEIRRLLNG